MTLSKLRFHPLVFKWTQRNSKQFTFHIILNFVLFTVLLYGIVHLTFAFCGIDASKEFQAYYGTLSYPLSTPDVERLEDYLEDSFLPAHDKGICAEALYKQYFWESDYTRAIDQVRNAIYYYTQTKESYSIALSYINMAHIMNSMNAFENAEAMLKDVLEMDISDKDQRNAITYCSYVTLADIYSQTDRLSEALSALDTAVTYFDSSEEVSAEYEYLEQLIKARCYLLQKDYDNCDRILSALPASPAFLSNPFLNTHISYLDIRSKLYLQTGDLESALQETKELITYCQKYHYKNLKLQHMADIVSLCHNLNFNDIRIAAYEYTPRTEYPVLLKECTELTAKFMASTFISLNEEVHMRLYTRQLKWKVILLITFFSVIGLVLLLILKKSINKSRLDALTGTYNRRHFDYIYDAVLMNRIPFSIIIFDIDNFKSCNDTFGHEFGDEVLRKVSHTAKKSLFAGCSLYRYGGEEFCVVCPQMAPQKACQLAELIRQNVENLSWEQNTAITISLGVADSQGCERPLTLADERLYYSKHHGKNRYTFC